jgi:ABC-type branched-subunit amino acid transport system ATPase component/ABC-type branched-subunit amino acid transport system permease subunit
MRLLIYGAAACVLALFPVLAGPGYHIYVGQSIALTAVAAIGLNLLLGLSGQMSLGQAGFYAVGAYGSALLAAKLHAPLWLAMPAGVALAGLAGGCVGLVALRTRGLHLAMATLAFGFIAGIVAQRWVSLTGGTMGLIGVPVLDFGSRKSGPTYFYWVAAGCLLAVQILSDYVHGSAYGRNLLALKQSEAFARTIGLNVPAWRLGVFAAAAALAGLAGVLFAHQNGFVGSDAFSLDLSLMLLIGVVIGGLGSSYGALLGTVVVVAISETIADLHDYAALIYGGILLVVLLLLPEGIIGLFARRNARSLRPGAAAGAMQSLPAAPTGGIAVLELDGVTKRYAGVVAIDRLSFTVRPGTIHALIGPNGAGKSTLINVIAGLSDADAGRVRFCGRDVTRMAAHRRARLGLARTFQNLLLVQELSVVENVLLGLQARNRPFWSDLPAWLLGRHEAALLSEAHAILHLLGIDDLAAKTPGELSYGHRKLCEIARAMAQSPMLFLLDEPVAGLNEEEASRIAEVVRGLREGGATILLVEHNMDFVMAISDAVTVLDHGVRIAEGPPHVVRQDQAVIDAYLGQEAA